MTSSLIAFIIGAGPRVGKDVAAKLKKEGYKVALGSRNPKVEQEKAEGYLPVQVDASQAQSVADAFQAVKAGLGAAPNVVVYNAAALTLPSIAGDPFSIPSAQFTKDVQTAGLSIHTAIHEANKGFASLSSSVPRVFIATGNALPWIGAAIPDYATLQVGKNVSYYLINLATASVGDKGFRYYFASEVSNEGKIPPGAAIHGSAHATAYWNLIKRKEQGQWDARFLSDGTEFKH